MKSRKKDKKKNNNNNKTTNRRKTRTRRTRMGEGGGEKEGAKTAVSLSSNQDIHQADNHKYQPHHGSIWCLRFAQATHETLAKGGRSLNRGVQPDVINVARREASDLSALATLDRLFGASQRERFIRFARDQLFTNG
ncbi:hypothetical protein ElyMa_003623100 [Elysia marginata]|uniref:Uncharacterized protein n=1 Tax=Elysia marginata TaxID=1093978 RepID=A0AAV4EUB9_9GAST|nr:hypothetical protein ElyMa_003623100 [Elysia marginata]